MHNATSPSAVQGEPRVRPIRVPDVGGSLPYENGKLKSALKVILHHEGGYSADPDDPGGVTNYGISLRYAKSAGDLDGDDRLDFDLDGDGDVDAADIRKLTPVQAAEAYRLGFWLDVYDRLPECIAIKTFDLAVNMGRPQAHKILQRGVRAVSDERLIDDGVLGARSINAIKCANPEALLAAIRCTAAAFYTELAIRRPASRKFLGGWLNRAYF